MRLYKLTDANNETKGKTVWGSGVTHTARVPGNRLCSNQVIHAYTSPLLAKLMNPVHGNYKLPKCWEAIGEVVASDNTKVGVKSLTTEREINLPKVTTNQAVAFGILCALQVYHEPSFVAWAESWLQDTDRSVNAAYAAAVYADAANAAYAAAAANAAYAAVYADAANAAYAAAYAAANNIRPINFEELAKKAVKE